MSIGGSYGSSGKSHSFRCIVARAPESRQAASAELLARLGRERALWTFEAGDLEAGGFDRFPHGAGGERFVLLGHDIGDVLVDIGPHFDDAGEGIELAGDLLSAV